MKYSRLFSPIKLADGLELRNRIVMAPMATNFADAFGVPTPDQYAYYRYRARKGVAMIVTESNYVREDGKNGPTRMGLHSDHVIPSHQKLTRAVHEEGAKVCAQLHHGGYTISPKLVGRYPISFSASPLMTRGDNLVGQIPRKMSIKDIKDLILCYANAVERAVASGYDAIQLHCAHGYFLNSCLSPHTNKRTDVYGGSDENRMRIVLEIFAAMRERVGNKYPMTVRFSGQETWDGGYNSDFIIKVIKALEPFNICEVSISGGQYEVPEQIAPPYWYPKGTYASVAGRIRKSINIPVSTVGRIINPQVAEDILARGDADLLYIGRELVAFPEFAEAARLGQPIRECLGCNVCFHYMSAGQNLRCTVNPWIGRDEELLDMVAKGVKQTDRPKKVAVIGGGPAGLTAAAEAAKRGHQVNLYEGENQLGGKLPLGGSIVAGKDGILSLVAHQEYQARHAGVNIQLNKKITAAGELNNPDFVVVAVGGTERKITIPGLDKMWTAEQAMVNLDRMGQNVVIIGGGLVGCELAEALALKGRNVSIVEMLDDILIGHELPNRRGEIVKICDLGVWVYVQSQVIGAEKGMLSVKFKEVTLTLPYDDVVNATGYVRNTELQQRLTEAGLNVSAIGDGVAPGKIYNATQSGVEVAKNIP